MGLKVKDRAKPKLPPVEPGVYIAVCVGVIDLGEQYSEKFKNYRNEVQFVWELTGETVEVDGETVYTYRFGAGGEVSSEWAERVTEREEEGLLLVTVQVSEGEWNEIVIDDGAKSAAMRDANCSRRKDCCAMQPVGEGGGVIVCIPHGLRILPLSEEDFSRPSVG